ncbi:MAG TPA: hypothetical protein VMR37_03415 [Rhabdochlamydiaceae bacterium]|nr:hypothetical protein [Rhabdochlamydiaceae bacterium]
MKSIVEKARDCVCIANIVGSDFPGDSVYFAQALLEAVEVITEIEKVGRITSLADWHSREGRIARAFLEKVSSGRS